MSQVLREELKRLVDRELEEYKKVLVRTYLDAKIDDVGSAYVPGDLIDIHSGLCFFGKHKRIADTLVELGYLRKRLSDAYLTTTKGDEVAEKIIKENKDIINSARAIEASHPT